MRYLSTTSFMVSMVAAYNQSLSDCNAFAALFGNTCTNGSVQPSSISTQTEVNTYTCTG